MDARPGRPSRPLGRNISRLLTYPLIDSTRATNDRLDRFRGLYGMMGLNYEHRPKELNVHTLAFRRKREQLIQVYKLLHNHYDADYRNLFHKVGYDVTRGNSQKLKTIRTHLSLRSRFFLVAVIHAWNQLPNDVVNATTLKSFKTGITRHLKAEWFTLD